MTTHPRPKFGYLFIPALPLLVHCATATPVTPAPISPTEAPRLEAALHGTCAVTATQKLRGEQKSAEGLRLTFTPTGQLVWDIAGPFGDTQVNANYRLEGRNIVSDGMYKNMRVDGFGGKTLEIFLYDISETYYCTKT